MTTIASATSAALTGRSTAGLIVNVVAFQIARRYDGVHTVN